MLTEKTVLTEWIRQPRIIFGNYNADEDHNVEVDTDASPLKFNNIMIAMNIDRIQAKVTVQKNLYSNEFLRLFSLEFGLAVSS
eukprot:g1655.t1